MSHFTVAVISKKTKDIEEMLNPYWEDLDVEEYIAETKQQLINRAKKEKEMYTEEYKKGNLDNLWAQEVVKAKTDEELYKIYTEEEYTDKNGNIISTYNPNSKWDWYVVGGRWHNTIVLKDGTKADSAKIKDIDFDKMGENKDKLSREWDLLVERKMPKTEDEEETVRMNFYKPEYYINKYGNKENYIRIRSQFHTYALLDEEGWQEQGQMGYWGADDTTLESTNAFIETLNKKLNDPNNSEKTLTIVDCHI